MPRTESLCHGVRSHASGRVQSSAWICDFWSMLTATAFSGGHIYSPTTSLSFASNSGSVEKVKVSPDLTALVFFWVFAARISLFSRFFVGDVVTNSVCL